MIFVVLGLALIGAVGGAGVGPNLMGVVVTEPSGYVPYAIVGFIIGGLFGLVVNFLPSIDSFGGQSNSEE